MKSSYILVVDDEPDIRETVKEILEDEGYLVATAKNADEARHHFREHLPDAVLLDIWMPDTDGITLLKEWSEMSGGKLPSPVVMMSGHGTVETAVEATRLGAYDFLEKPLGIAKLLLTLERALQSSRLQLQANDSLHAAPFIEPTGSSQAITRLREQVKRIAQHDSWVLMSGEAGSGRETFARYIHANCTRAERPFVHVAVSSIEAGNAALELFGREEGQKIDYGRLEQARGGTLFLDEVADMDADVQKRLVGALDTGSFLRVGGSEPVHLDVRIIAATQKNLEDEVNEGRFREDLFFQLNVVPVVIPPLREHEDDVIELLNFYVDHYSSRERLPYRRFDTAAQNYLRQYQWPGNVRELKNLVQRLLIVGGDEEIEVSEVESAIGILSSSGQSAGISISFDQPLREAREDFERAYFIYQMGKHDRNVTQMAEEAGIERTHLYRKLKSLDIDVKAKRK
ncbi:sigma-54-dependent transcriptional regulator [Solemya elarraichensis gill symbiont]|uniref:Transcriptional regulator n=1 Tax=Solemya elarraichensis gill symbiont TaxID=1918949 RepID=A0A1T2LCK0_9GAMM|nr:sigma-54 dependent transcriptional regulator [Solemya elarraichensis gill symbiont]OOZ42828.1 transcriptional regulator [Solemya elarraichensis gill symbiont]